MNGLLGALGYRYQAALLAAAACAVHHQSQLCSHSDGTMGHFSSVRASMLATLPVWRWLDPLPILESREDDEKRKRKRGVTAKDKDPDEQDEERLRSVFE